MSELSIGANLAWQFAVGEAANNKGGEMGSNLYS